MEIKGRLHVRLPLLVRYGQVSLLLNQIAGFFNQPYLWKNSIDILVFYGRNWSSTAGRIWDCHFWLEVASCLSFNQIAGLFDWQFYLKDVFDFLHGDNHQGKVASNSWLGVVRYASGPIKWIDQKNQLTPLLSGNCYFIFLFYLFPCIFYQT